MIEIIQTALRTARSIKRATHLRKTGVSVPPYVFILKESGMQASGCKEVVVSLIWCIKWIKLLTSARNVHQKRQLKANLKKKNSEWKMIWENFLTYPSSFDFENGP